jgi:DNA polymerase-3 subunit gamma/tau
MAFRGRLIGGALGGTIAVVGVTLAIALPQSAQAAVPATATALAQAGVSAAWQAVGHAVSAVAPARAAIPAVATPGVATPGVATPAVAAPAPAPARLATPAPASPTGKAGPSRAVPDAGAPSPRTGGAGVSRAGSHPLNAAVGPPLAAPTVAPATPPPAPGAMVPSVPAVDVRLPAVHIALPAIVGPPALRPPALAAVVSVLAQPGWPLSLVEGPVLGVRPSTRDTTVGAAIGPLAGIPPALPGPVSEGPSQTGTRHPRRPGSPSGTSILRPAVWSPAPALAVPSAGPGESRRGAAEPAGESASRLPGRGAMVPRHAHPAAPAPVVPAPPAGSPVTGGGPAAAGAASAGGGGAVTLPAALALFLIFVMSTRVSLDLSAWRSTLLSLRLERPG